MQFNKITIQFLIDNYEKVAYTLPTPTYRRYITKYRHQGYVVITYKIKHLIRTEKQLLWVSNIKQSIKHRFKDKIEFIEYVETTTQENTKLKYTLEELSNYFPSLNTKYPKLLYTQNRKLFYKRLVWYGKRLYYYDIFFIEMLMYASLKMNKHISNPYNDKELISKVVQAFNYINKNKSNFKQKLDDKKRKEVLSSAGKKRGQQLTKEKEENKKKLKKMVIQKQYLKANGKPKILELAKDINLSRQTVSKLLKEIGILLYPLFFVPISYLSNICF
jgi:hypothetical protein